MEEAKIIALLKKANIINIQSIKPLVGGMMNESYLVRNNIGGFVLYISTKEANMMVNRNNEKEHQKIAYSLSTTSKNIYFDTNKGIKINEYIEGSSLDQINEFDYQKIATLLKKLHSSSTLAQTDYLPFLRFENEYEKNALKYRKTIDNDYKCLRDFVFAYRKELENRPLVFSHNDFQKSNIIRSNKDEYFAIDFEFVGNNDEIYDIACFGNQNVKEGRRLLDSYYNSPSKEEIKLYYLWRIFISLQWHNVAIVKHYNGEGKIHGYDFLKVANHFLENAKTAKKMFDNEMGTK